MEREGEWEREGRGRGEGGREAKGGRDEGSEGGRDGGKERGEVERRKEGGRSAHGLLLITLSLIHSRVAVSNTNSYNSSKEIKVPLPRVVIEILHVPLLSTYSWQLVSVLTCRLQWEAKYKESGMR